MSARYLLVRRGFAIFLMLLFSLANALFTLSYLHFFPSGDVGFAIAMGVSFGALLLWLSAPVIRRATKRIDRAFFRSDYDARQVLERLARDIRKVTRREQLATLLERELNQALHVRSMAIYLEGSDGRLILQNEIQPGMEPVLSPDIPLLQELTRRAEPFEIVPRQQGDGHPTPSIFGSIRPECLVPMMGSDGHLAGLVALGSRLSEQPYSGEDKRLLASVASQAELALESIQRGEEIAERIEADRRLVQEMEFARQVQARLFPQHLPALQTLEYTGACIQARQVGGDYYDFLESRPGRVAFVLADIAGKGVSGALIMANLQANLRSQYATAVEDPRRLLSSVNRLFFENTSGNSYATLFFADYEDATRQLRFVNCGHLPPLLVRSGRASDDSPCAVERLEPTCTVLGLFAQWECSVAEVRLSPGDLLVLYTDGVTEATNADGQEFGESRIIDTLRAHVDYAPATLVDVIVRAVQQFANGEQADDITLVVARCTA
jgi:serine phosphatase RsbU (regulator of sigma subunit)